MTTKCVLKKATNNMEEVPTKKKRTPSKGCSRLGKVACESDVDRCEYIPSPKKGVKSKCITRGRAAAATSSKKKERVIARETPPSSKKTACHVLRMKVCNETPECKWRVVDESNPSGRKRCRPEIGSAEVSPPPRSSAARTRRLAHDPESDAGKRAARKALTMSVSKQIAKLLGVPKVSCRKHQNPVSCAKTNGQCIWKKVEALTGKRQGKSRYLCVPNDSLLHPSPGDGDLPLPPPSPQPSFQAPTADVDDLSLLPPPPQPSSSSPAPLTPPSSPSPSMFEQLWEEMESNSPSDSESSSSDSESSPPCQEGDSTLSSPGGGCLVFQHKSKPTIAQSVFEKCFCKVSIPGDGNCFWASIVHQLKAVGIERWSAQTLREAIADAIQNASERLKHLLGRDVNSFKNISEELSSLINDAEEQLVSTFENKVDHDALFFVTSFLQTTVAARKSEYDSSTLKTLLINLRNNRAAFWGGAHFGELLCAILSREHRRTICLLSFQFSESSDEYFFRFMGRPLDATCDICMYIVRSGYGNHAHYDALLLKRTCNLS